MRLPHPAGDELRVLGTEVDDQDGVDGGIGHVGARRSAGRRAQWPMPTPWAFWRFLPSVCSAGATMTSAFWNSLTVS